MSRAWCASLFSYDAGEDRGTEQRHVAKPDQEAIETDCQTKRWRVCCGLCALPESDFSKVTCHIGDSGAGECVKGTETAKIPDEK